MDAPVAERIRSSITIVGAGVSGMAAAWQLARAGHRDMHVLELESDKGGTARSGTLPRSAYPMGAHYLPTPIPQFTQLRELLQDLGFVLGVEPSGQLEVDPTMVCRSPVERIKHMGLWQDGIYPGTGQSSEDEAQWNRWRDHLRALNRRTSSDGRRLFDLPVERSSVDLRHLDQISMATYLDRLGLTSWRLRWTVDYACRDDYGCTLDETSAFAGLHHYLARGLEDEHDRVLLTWPEGNGRLVDAMAQAADLGDRLHLDHAAVFIDPDTGELTAHDLVHDRRVVFESKVILWAAPRFILPYVLPAGRDPLPHGALTYAPWLVAGVQVSRAPRGIGAPLSWDNVDVKGDHLGYVVAHHGESLMHRNRSEAVLTFYQPWTAPDASSLAARRSEMLGASLSSLVDGVVGALDAMHPGLARTVTHVDIARWGHAMIRPRPGHLFGSQLELARAPLGVVMPCATDVAGLPLFEEAFGRGTAAAQWALARV